MEENNNNVNEDIFSKVMRAGRRTYFFDVRSTKAGDYYLTISESKKFTNEDGTFYFRVSKNEFEDNWTISSLGFSNFSIKIKDFLKLEK